MQRLLKLVDDETKMNIKAHSCKFLHMFWRVPGPSEAPFIDLL